MLLQHTTDENFNGCFLYVVWVQLKRHLFREASPHQSHKSTCLQTLHRVTQFYLPHDVTEEQNGYYVIAGRHFRTYKAMQTKLKKQ